MREGSGTASLAVWADSPRLMDSGSSARVKGVAIRSMEYPFLIRDQEGDDISTDNNSH